MARTSCASRTSRNGKGRIVHFTNRLKKEQPETASYRNRKLTESNIEEWKALMAEAREIGLTVQEVKSFFKTMGR